MTTDKIIIVLVGNIQKFPPAVSLIDAALAIGLKMVLVATKTPYNNENLGFKKLEVEFDYEARDSAMWKAVNMPRIHRMLWKEIERVYDKGTVIWVMNDLTVKFLGRTIYKTKYVIHFLELSDRLYYYNKLPLVRMNERKLCNNAVATVVAEYNRKHIMAANWDLKKMPLIFHNKPFISDDIPENNIYGGVLRELENRKIILYQGLLGKERPLGSIIRAVERLGDRYAFVVMSQSEDIYANVGYKNYYYIPFIPPPEHLQVTAKAYIGVMSYFPTKDTGYSKLNTLYCAPNKVYEYGLFGIPMIGNDIPGLRFLFEAKGCGVCFDYSSETNIIGAIKRIEAEYKFFSRKSREAYDSVDSVEELKMILRAVNSP